MPDLNNRIVIIGGGFGGLYAAKALTGNTVTVTLIDRRNFHLFQPLLYQVATGGLSPADIAYPLRTVFKRQQNLQVILGEVIDIDFTEKHVTVEDRKYVYDFLIIATGSQNYYFGHNEWAKQAPGLKNIEEATFIRGRILSAFEQAELETDSENRAALLTFAIIGGGPAGVEMAGAIAELSRLTLLHEFRNINPEDARILLIEGADRILPPYPASLSQKAARSLQRLGIEIMTRTKVTQIDSRAVTAETEKGRVTIAAHTVLWTAGVTGSSLGGSIEKNTSIVRDKSGRIAVDKYCRLPGYNDVFVIGDLALFKDTNSLPLPGTAPVAMQQGRYVAKVIKSSVKKKDSPPFRFKNRGNLAVIGRSSAVAFSGKLKFSGIFAWLLWLFVHLMYLVGFENRLLVFLQWAFNYFTKNKSARLITNLKYMD